MSTKRMTDVSKVAMIIAAIVVGMLFVLNSSAYAAAAAPAPSGVVMLPTGNAPAAAPKAVQQPSKGGVVGNQGVVVVQQPFVRPFFNPFFFRPFFNPFFFDVDPFFFD